MTSSVEDVVLSLEGGPYQVLLHMYPYIFDCFLFWYVFILQNGEILEGRVDEPKGDPGNTLSRSEITDKAMRLAAFSGGATPSEMSNAIERLWNIRKQPKIGLLIS